MKLKPALMLPGVQMDHLKSGSEGTLYHIDMVRTIFHHALDGSSPLFTTAYRIEKVESVT